MTRWRQRVGEERIASSSATSRTNTACAATTLTMCKATASNTILAAAGYNFRLLLKWLRLLLCLCRAIVFNQPRPLAARNSNCSRPTQ
jgi:hypothetical protein